MPNVVKNRVVESLQKKRGCFWVNKKSLVVWDGPNNKGVVMLSKSAHAPFELDPNLEGARLIRFTTRRMKRAFVKRCSRELSRVLYLPNDFINLPAEVFDEEPELSGVEDLEVRRWLSLL